jgi:hypothetical protein
MVYRALMRAKSRRLSDLIFSTIVVFSFSGVDSIRARLA